MSTRSRLTLAVACGVLVVILGTVGAAAAVVYNSETIHVRIQENGADGDTLSLRLPAVLLQTALELVPDEVFRRAAPKLQPIWPVIRVICEELRRAPDALLVEVSSPEESVKISKKDGAILLLVHSSKETIRISVPLNSLSHTLQRVEDRASRILG